MVIIGSKKEEMNMKNLANIFLLSAGFLLLFTGCQEKINHEESAASGMAVKFSATTAPETRTAYSGVVTSEGNKKMERINWIAGDKVMLWSDKATVRPDGNPYFSGNNKLAVYNIGSINNDSPDKSVASVEDPMDDGLQYPDKTTPCQFWGVYPAGAVKASPDENNTIVFNNVILAEQELAANEVSTATNDYTPDMNQAVLLSYKDGIKGGDKTVEMLFNPAFTAFEFNITTRLEKDLTITAMELISMDITGGSASTAMSGGFTATCPSGTWTWTINEGASKSVKAVLPGEGLTINAANPTLSLTVLALPQDLTNLKVTFYTNEGTKSLKLTTTPGGTEYVTFAACKKHRINGLILPTGWQFEYITLDLKVLDWEAVDVDGVSSEFPQATQFAVTGEGVKNGDSDLHLGGTGDDRQKDPYRQQWYFVDRQTVTVFFKIMLPVNGTWKLEPVGGTEENPVEGDKAYFSFKNAYDDTDTTPLDGPIGSDGNTAVKINITYNGPDGEAHTFYFHSYAIDENGNKYNIDSETQIYDRGRGYHTFFVNSPLYNNQ